MPRLSLETKREIIKQLKEGVSLNRISKQFGIYKSTLYYYYKKLNGKKFKEPQFTLSSSELEGEIVGIFAGDGSQYYEPKKCHYEVNVHFGGHNYNYALEVKKLFEGFFNKEFLLRPESRGVYRLRTLSKKIYYYFQYYMDYKPQIKHCTVHLKRIDFPLNFKIGFLRGLIDTDGHCSYSEKDRRWRIIYYTTSKKLADDICCILSELFITHGMSRLIRKNHRKDGFFKPIYHIYIWKRSADRFINIIKPRKLGRMGR